MPSREYERSHPWIRFEADLRAAPPRLWALLGQAAALCRQVADAALPPGAAAEMQKVYLVKGVQATTAIEGNTLSTEQIRERVEGRPDLPPSQDYLGREVDNVLRACNEIAATIVGGGTLRLTAGWIADCNRQVLAGLGEHLEEGVVPGEIPAHAVGVGRYRGAPRADCAFLLDRLCHWLEDEPGLTVFGQDDDDRIATAILHAILVHLYIAWIHPFGDGNGRTARLVELMLLARAGVPLTSAQLPSNHYNLTRAEYYRQLDRASRANDGRGDPLGFIGYAAQGFVDGLKEQCRTIDASQAAIAWRHFVFERFRRERRSPALERRRELVLALTLRSSRPVSRADLRRLDPAIAERYAGKTDKTLTRDLNWLLAEDLIERRAGGYRARIARMRSFLPPRAEPERTGPRGEQSREQSRDRRRPAAGAGRRETAVR